jgi:hypothetical protein
VGELQDLLGLVDAVEVLSLHRDILPSERASAHVVGLVRRGRRFAAVLRGVSPNVVVTAFYEVRDALAKLSNNKNHSFVGKSGDPDRGA